jgi:hypothetical protein
MKRQVCGTVDIEVMKNCFVDLQIEFRCPTCRYDMVIDLNDSGTLRHPVIGENIDVSMYCQRCNTDWKIPLKIISTVAVIEYDSNKIEEDI